MTPTLKHNLKWAPATIFLRLLPGLLLIPFIIIGELADAAAAWIRDEMPGGVIRDPRTGRLW